MVIKATVAAKKTAVVAKGLVGTAHTIGTAQTVAAVGLTLTIVGGIAWSVERYDDLKACYDLWNEGDKIGAVKKFSSLCSKISSLPGNPHGVIHSGTEILQLNGADITKVAVWKGSIGKY